MSLSGVTCAMPFLGQSGYVVVLAVSTGILTVILAPAPGELSSSRVPWALSARSAMLCRPWPLWSPSESGANPMPSSSMVSTWSGLVAADGDVGYGGVRMSADIGERFLHDMEQLGRLSLRNAFGGGRVDVGRVTSSTE